MVKDGLDGEWETAQSVPSCLFLLFPDFDPMHPRTLPWHLCCLPHQRSPPGAQLRLPDFMPHTVQQHRVVSTDFPSPASKLAVDTSSINKSMKKNPQVCQQMTKPLISPSFLSFHCADSQSPSVHRFSHQQSFCQARYDLDF